MAADAAPSFSAREAMERLNAEAAALHIWLRTQANAPAQRPWSRHTEIEAAGRLAAGRVGAAQLKPLAHLWRWSDIAPYLDRIAKIAREADPRNARQGGRLSGGPPIEFAERQQFLLTNPGLGGRLQVTATMRCAVSIYNPGDIAPVHIHTPNASRTILSEEGGYTTIEGERCTAARGDLILTPNGTWHDHGNDGGSPVVWIDVLDFPLMEFLDCVWLDEEFSGITGHNEHTQAATHAAGYSHCLYGQGGIVPGFVSHRRGSGHAVTPMFHYRGADVRQALVIDGSGRTEIAGRCFDWHKNDIFVVPGFLWRRHRNVGGADALLYVVSDAPLLEKIGQYRVQGRLADDAVAELVA